MNKLPEILLILSPVAGIRAPIQRTPCIGATNQRRPTHTQQRHPIMITLNQKARLFFNTLAAISFLIFASHSHADTPRSLIDDFADEQNNSLGLPRLFMDDTSTGGGTTTVQSVSEGVLYVQGEIVPPRGQPGWASSIFLLNAQGLPQDVSTFEGIRLLIKVNEGNISISANSADVTNYDYHAAAVTTKADGEFHEVKIPFASMKRAWSEQTPLNTETIASLSIVAFGLQKTVFEFEVDEVSFY
jgi:hypothetical protein